MRAFEPGIFTGGRHCLVMENKVGIEHSAVIKRVLPQKFEVEVVIVDNESDACSSCAAAAVCKHSNHTLRVPVPNPSDFVPGQRVLLQVSEVLHHKAVAMMLVLPCLMLVLPVIALCLLGLPEWIAMLAGVSACFLTYLGMWLYRKRLNSDFYFSIKSASNNS